MTDLEAAIFWRLTTENTQVTSICPSAQIQPQEAKEGTPYPRIIYWGEISNVDRTFQGRSGLITAKVTIHCQGQDAQDAYNLRTAVISTLDDEDSNNDGSEGTWDGVIVQGCFLQDEQESTQKIGSSGQESLVYDRELVFKVQYNS